MSERIIVIDGWLLTQTGHGMASHASRLVHALAQSALASRLRIVMPASGIAFAPVGVQVIVLPDYVCKYPLICEAIWQNRLGAFMKHRNPDDVLLALSPFYSWSWPKRVVVVWHDLIPFRFRRYMGYVLYRRLLFRARLDRVRRTGFVISDSHYTVSELKFFLTDFRTPVKTIHLWVEPEMFARATSDEIEAVREKYRLPKRYWLYVGGYDYRKNVEFLVESYGLAKKHCQCPPLVLAGKIPSDLGKPVCDVAGAIRKSCLNSDNIRLPGFIHQEDLAAVYAGAELFVYPSLSEGFGLPPLEAMACGCPAIVADGSSLPEVVVDANYRFSPVHSPSLTRLLEKAARVPMSLNPGFDATYFSVPRGIKEYCEVLEKCAE